MLLIIVFLHHHCLWVRAYKPIELLKLFQLFYRTPSWVVSWASGTQGFTIDILILMTSQSVLNYFMPRG